MKRALIAQLRCPYSGGPFRITKEVVADAERIQYGLIESRSFSFPIVDGVLLLSLAKGYGGSEESIQPYVPLQVAAIRHLEAGDVAGLKDWIDKHIPLASGFIRGTQTQTYLEYASRLEQILDRVATEDLIAIGRSSGVLGHTRGKTRLREHLRLLRRRLRNRIDPRRHQIETLHNYFVERFFAPRATSTLLQLASLPLDGRLLSLCSGHGVLEHLVRVRGHRPDTVCVDGQFLNLLIARHYVQHGADLICQDVQLGLPFPDQYFDGVYSSTCLPEIPTQRSFATEAVRVTRRDGWTLFESIWNLQFGVERVSNLRFYRYCQNFFAKLSDYVDFFEEIAGEGRQIGVDITRKPSAYLGSTGWSFDRHTITHRIAENVDDMISVLIVDGPSSTGLQDGSQDWISADTLSISPAYTVRRQGQNLHLSRRPAFTEGYSNMVSRDFPALAAQATLSLDDLNKPEVLKQALVDGLLAALPDNFDRDYPKLSYYGRSAPQ